MIDCNDHDLQHRPQCSLWPRFWTMASFTQATLHQCGCFIVESFSFSTASWETTFKVLPPSLTDLYTQSHKRTLIQKMRVYPLLPWYRVPWNHPNMRFSCQIKAMRNEQLKDKNNLVSLLIVYFTSLNWTSGQNNLLSILIVYFMSLNWTSSHSFEHDFFHMDS